MKTFRDVFEDFLISVKNKEMDRMTGYIDANLPINVLLPGKKPILNAGDFISSQKSFFENNKSSFDYEVIDTQESEELGFGVCRAKVNSDQTELNVQICFLFKKIQGQWKLIFDQNSIL